MSSVTIRPEKDNVDGASYRAVSGNRQSIGRTAGEALDSLIDQENGSVDSSAIFVQRMIPDSFFTREQIERMQELLARCDSRSPAENAELDALIDAELDATVLRTDSLVSSR